MSGYVELHEVPPISPRLSTSTSLPSNLPTNIPSNLPSKSTTLSSIFTLLLCLILILSFHSFVHEANRSNSLETLLIKINGIESKLTDIPKNKADMKESLAKVTKAMEELKNTRTQLLRFANISVSRVVEKNHQDLSAALASVDARVELAIRQTLGNHETMAVLLGNASKAMEDVVLTEINHSNMILTMLQLDAKANHDYLKASHLFRLNENLNILNDNLNMLQDKILDEIDLVKFETNTGFKSLTMNLTTATDLLNNIAANLSVSFNQTNKCVAPGLNPKACQPGWATLSSATCTKHFPTPSTFEEAEALCQGQAAHLPYIKTPQENSAWTDMGRVVWLGVSDMGE